MPNNDPAILKAAQDIEINLLACLQLIREMQAAYAEDGAERSSFQSPSTNFWVQAETKNETNK